MTLVLPYGAEQIGNNSLYSGGARNSSMPCVFEGEALDFESALMTAEWNSDMSDFDTPADDFSSKAPSDGTDLKRKIIANGSEAHSPQSKKPRTDADDLVSPVRSEVLSSSSSSSSSSSDGHEDEGSSNAEADDEEYVPRRRGPQMWNSRQRWKDERKRVLKLSLGKLAEIEDPELCMHRSVVINNTVKRLHLDIRNERQAKLRHRQQRMDFFAERFHPISSAESINSDLDAPQQNKTSRTSDLYDDSSCDEMFGVSEDFLRVTIPDRRVSSPIPTNPVDHSNSDDSSESPMDTSDEQSANRESQTSCYTSSSESSSSSCDNSADSASSAFLQSKTNGDNNSTCVSVGTSTNIVNGSTNPVNCSMGIGNSSSSNSNNSTANNSSRRLVSSSGSQQCATQYRTSRDASPDGTFPPRVPILDSVVYHSLLASLESS